MLMTSVWYGKCVPMSRATQMFMPWRIDPPMPAPMNTTRYDIIARSPSFPYGFGARKSWSGKACASGTLIAITPTLALLWQALQASVSWR